MLTWWDQLLLKYRQRNGVLPLGAKGEFAAERFLVRGGMKILARGFETGVGEVDLIAADGETIVFVEVKTRESDIAGHPTEAVDAEKQRKITYTALEYLKRHDLLEYSARFDVVSIIWPAGSDRPEIQHFCDAFQPIGFGQLFS